MLTAETALLPDTAELLAGLRSIIGDGDPVAVTQRRPNLHSSTFPTEIVTCRLGDGTERTLFCKYGTPLGYEEFGHKGSVGFEAEVYRRVLGPFCGSTAPFVGALDRGRPDEAWLVCGYLDGTQMHKVPAAFPLSARWLGRFHRLNESRIGERACAFLPTYDRDHYLGWARRTAEYTASLFRQGSWLAELCGRFEDVADLLLTAPITVIHGEYYPKNILFCGGAVYPVDWESAAFAAGEIDLASLAEGWADEDVRECCRIYVAERWPDGVPAGFERRFDAGRLYLCFRWLGSSPAWAADGAEYLDQARAAGERLGLI